MALQRKILCITNAALLSASIYASAPESGASQSPVPAAVAGANWMGTFKTIGVAAVSSAGTYYAMDEINRRMNMGIPNPYLTSAAAMVAVTSICSGGGLFAAAPIKQGGTSVPPTSVTDASPSRNHTVKKAIGRAPQTERFLRGSVVTDADKIKELTASLNALHERKEHYKGLLAQQGVEVRSMKEELDQARANIKELNEANTQLRIDAARNEGKDSKIKELLSQIAKLQESCEAEVRSRSQQQTDAGAAILKLNSEISSLRKRLERAQSTCGSIADQSEYARSEARRSVASTMRRNVETFFGEILEKDERDILRTALADYRIKKTELKRREEGDSRAETQAAEQALDDVC